MKSAVYGFDDLFQMANGLCVDADVELEFKPQLVDIKNIISSSQLTYDIVILPPLLQSKSQYVTDDKLVEQHACGAIITAVCAGCFALAATNIAKNRALTTHWGLVDAIKLQYPEHNFDIDKIIRAFCHHSLQSRLSGCQCCAKSISENHGGNTAIFS